MALQHKYDDMTDDKALDRFMRGLDFRLRRQLYIYLKGLPMTLKDARERAILLNQALQGSYFGSAPNFGGRCWDTTFPTMAGPLNSSMPLTQHNAAEQMAIDNMELRSKWSTFRGKCYECQQYGH